MQAHLSYARYFRGPNVKRVSLVLITETRILKTGKIHSLFMYDSNGLKGCPFSNSLHRARIDVAQYKKEEVAQYKKEE